ncbi:MAG: hypothetical protein COV59_03895 [Candidatus Magasanikbacteria bacterium CG11_big_fil_rev_8_21_14_0_20_39_34]|uniref:LamG-like jellyroll fold domain-containing protein n=1 Tax=Candidatus Magasanikbacteria bacterium CG11_big_fil_rev_8_21_14_0_20_39_34 TaxID=1974653 RepID=A0A2H0N4I5_9BACT|nr:MAG: hypothetical protein COV59_03895 [Candidatus Magasanikbacteria bacterium CG11_big_fil_rev_8_21_14_0_20_39_34]
MFFTKKAHTLLRILSIGILLTYPVLVYATTVTDSSCTGEFGSGTNSDTQCTSEQVELDSTGLTNGSGNFTSRIIDAGSSVTWSSLAWTPNYPYLKNLPNSAGAESAYTNGNANMSNNLLLWHLDEASGNFTDSSGNSHTGTATGATAGGTGILNNAVTFDGNDYVTASNDSDLARVGDFTVSAWIKDTSGNYTITAGIAGKIQLLSSPSRYYGYSLSKSGGWLQFYTGNSTGAFVVSDAQSLDANWHFVVGVISSGTNYLYVDGVLQSGSASTIYTDQGSFTIGKNFSNTNNFYWIGNIDEVSVWNRALSGTEILNMYKRGALRLKYQVRSCDDNACSGETFAGPDGTGSSYYSELTTSTDALPSKTLTNVSDNEYFQYKAFFETSSTTLTPELLDVTITHSAPTLGVPEFSDALYIVTILFGLYYLIRFSSQFPIHPSNT